MELLKPIVLPNQRQTSNLGFGCAGIMQLPSARARESLLRTAVDLGITHFDLARMYGMGAGERIVGSALKTERDRLTFATKFGIPFSAPNALMVKVQSVGRWVIKLHPALRQRAKKIAGAAQPASDFSPEEMRRSLQTSLDQSGLGHFDLFFLHEPHGLNPIPSGLEILLEEKKKSGAIGAYGVSAHMPHLLSIWAARPAICGEAVQYNYSYLRKFADRMPSGYNGYAGMFGVLGQNFSSVIATLERHPEMVRTWSERLGCDLSQRENVGVVLLATAFQVNPGGLILYFTSKPERLRSVVKKLSENRFEADQLAGFRDAICGLDDHAN